MHLMYEYAVKYKIIPAAADITCYIDIDKKVVRYPKKPFITRQLNRVKKLANSDAELARWAMCIVMMCYSGVRPGEFLAIQKSDVKLKQRYLSSVTARLRPAATGCADKPQGAALFPCLDG